MRAAARTLAARGAQLTMTACTVLLPLGSALVMLLPGGGS